MCCTCNPIGLYLATLAHVNIQQFKLLWYKREVLNIKCKEILTHDFADRFILSGERMALTRPAPVWQPIGARSLLSSLLGPTNEHRPLQQGCVGSHHHVQPSKNTQLARQLVPCSASHSFRPPQQVNLTIVCTVMSAADWYAHKSLGDGLYWIQERFYQSENRSNIWLLRGSHQDVVIDTGLGLRSLPDYIDAKGLLGEDPQRKNPLLAIATHTHFDHSGGLHQFQQVGVHSAEVDALSSGDNFEMVTWLSDREITEAPSPGWRARHYKVEPVQPTHILQEGERDVASLLIWFIWGFIYFFIAW